MFEQRRIDLLTNKLYLLGEEELRLLKEGNNKEAEKISKEIDEISKKIQKLTEKELGKTEIKADKISAELDKKLKQYDEILPKTTDEEAEEFLNEIMRSK